MVDALLNAATFRKSYDDYEKRMSFMDFRTWCLLVPTIRKFLGSLLMPQGRARPGYQVPHLLYQDSVDSNMLSLKKEYAWFIGGALPNHELEEWKLLYNSSLHGLSFNTFLRHTSNTGMSASVLISKDREGCVYGGYASQAWERHSDFYGDMKSILFQLKPKASIFRPTGADTNIQWCATNFTSDNIPNGIGFGGKSNFFGLFISASFEQGHTFSCLTFDSPSLSRTNGIQPDVIECWGIVQASNKTRHKSILKPVGVAGNSND